MFFQNLFLNSLIFAQSLEVSDITGLMSVKELTVNGLLLVAIVMLWRRMTSAEEKIDVIRKEREVDNLKYIELLVNVTRATENATKVIDENTKMYARLEKLLDK